MICIILLLMSTTQFRVRSIEVRGNEYFKESAIKKVMLTRTKNFLRKGIFNESVFSGDVEAVENLYRHEGFIDVSVERAVTYDSSVMRVDIVLQISEGRRHFIERIFFQGNSVLTAESLAQQITMQPGEVFDPRGITADNYVIRYLYDDLGYADVQVGSAHEVAGDSVTVTHSIVEGTRQHVDQVEVLGLRHTDTSIVLREVSLASGDIFRYARILESQRALYKLGVFMTIRTQVENSTRPDHKDVRFLLTERELMVINLRVGYGTRDRVRFGLGFTHYNLLGRAWQGRLEGKLSFVEQRVNTSVTFPRTFLLPGRLGVGFFFKRLAEIGYVTRSLGGNVVTRFDVGLDELSAKYEVEGITTSYEEGDSIEHDLLHGITVGWLRDRRDDPFHTTRGYYANVNCEVSGIIFPSDVDYIRPTAQIRSYRSMIAGVVLAVAVRAGMVEPFEPTEEVPVYRRFYCGGASSVRGYSERAIGPVDENDNPSGGRYLGEVSTELRFPLYKILGGVVFIDGGNIWQEYDEIPLGLRWGIGIGLRIRSPIGSVRLDYGFKIDRREDEPAGSLHFAIGEAF